MNLNSEYRDLPLSALTESKTNPRRTFEDDALKELAESIRVQGVLSPLLVRPVLNNVFEIVFGARRYRAAILAEIATVPVRIANLSDAEALEAQLIENLQRRDVHPLEEAQGFHALLILDEPKYSLEQIAAKTGKSPAYVAQRLRLTELSAPVVDAFYADEIGVGHALLLAKLQPDQQETALAQCFREEWSPGGKKAKRILLPVRQLQQWIEHQLMLILKSAPFDTRDVQLLPAPGSCEDCPKRTGHNRLLFADFREDACTDPTCYSAKLEAHVKASIQAKPKLVRISTGYGHQPEGGAIIPRNKYVEIRTEKPDSTEKAKWPEYKICKDTTEAIVTEGSEKGEIRKVCANPNCPTHRPKKQIRSDAREKAEQERQRKEEAIAQTTGIRTLAAIAAAVPVRLMKRDLLFVVEHLAGLLDERRLEIVARQRGIKKGKSSDSIGKLFAAYLRRAEESALGGLLVEITIINCATRQNATQILRNAAAAYKVDVDAIALNVKQELTSKEKSNQAKKPAGKAAPTKAKESA